MVGHTDGIRAGGAVDHPVKVGPAEKGAAALCAGNHVLLMEGPGDGACVPNGLYGGWRRKGCPALRARCVCLGPRQAAG